MRYLRIISICSLCILLITSACTITIQTGQPDYEATERHIEKSTLQTIKDQAEAESEESKAQEEEENSSGEESSSESNLPQGTQAAPTAQPTDFRDVLLPTGQFVIIDTQTPTIDIVPPKISADQGKVVIIPSSTPEPYVGGSLIKFNVYKGCGRYLTIQFMVNNQSTVPLESAMVTCENISTNVIKSNYSNNPFHSSTHECDPGDTRIKAGVDSHVVVYMGNERLNSGEAFRCTLTLYTVDLPYQDQWDAFIIQGPQFTAP